MRTPIYGMMIEWGVRTRVHLILLFGSYAVAEQPPQTTLYQPTPFIDKELVMYFFGERR